MVKFSDTFMDKITEEETENSFFWKNFKSTGEPFFKFNFKNGETTLFVSKKEKDGFLTKSNISVDSIKHLLTPYHELFFKHYEFAPIDENRIFKFVLRKKMEIKSPKGIITII